jgi:small-conductance mechanosensitive channel
MFEETQATIESNLSFLGEHAFIEALVIILASFAIAWGLDRYVVATLRKLAQRTRGYRNEQLIAYLHKPLFNTVLLLGLASATTVMEFSARMESAIFAILQTIAIILWAQFSMRALKAVLTRLARESKKSAVLTSQTLPLFQNLANIAVLVLAIYYIFSAFNVDMTAWLASAGIVGIAVGFAAKDTLANLFSGVFILADAPYKIGDFVVLETGERGQITHIGIRSTRMLTRDDVEVTVPNSVMGNTTIINESGGPHEKYRIRVKVGVAYGSDIDLVREILMSVADNEAAVCGDPEPRVRFRMFGASSLDFELLCWVDEPMVSGRVIDALNCAVYKKFREEKIEIPYSKQDVYVKELPSG